MGMLISKPKKKALVDYKISVKTSDNYKRAGSNADIYIKILGEKEGTSTAWINLGKLLRDDFERGKRDEFVVKAKNVGKPLAIRLDIRHRVRKDCWACDDIAVTFKAEEITFPIYDWIEEEDSFVRGKAFTHDQVSHQQIKSIRAREIEKSRVKYQWVCRPHFGELGWGLPRFMNVNSYWDLPRILLETEARESSLIKNGIGAIINQQLARIKDTFFGLDDLESYTGLYKFLQTDQDPVFINRWQTDIEFGRQALSGISPTSLSRCFKLPEGCRIQEAHVKDFLRRGYSLEQEMENGRIYIGDYSKVFQGVRRNKNDSDRQLYCPDAIGMFYVNDELSLIPIAIQLIPNDEESIFTPRDSTYDWLLAKMYYRTASGNLHEWHYHFMLTHNIMEPFAVSLFRCLPRSHPVYKLLRPHLQSVPGINSQARVTLIKAGSEVNKSLAMEGEDLVKSMFKTFEMDDLDIKKVLESRGLDDRELLPKNYFRDDAIALWNIIKSFVSDVLSHYYRENQQVQNDEELNAFAKDVAMEGLGWQDENTRGMPTSFSTIDDLVQICTIVIYTSSVQHTAVNFPQYEVYKFIPNAPLGMRLPPHKRGEADMKRILKSLPDVHMATTVITLGYTLTTFSPDETYLGEYPMRLFTEQEILTIMDRYRTNLKMLSDQIKKRNDKAGPDAYPWLLPERVPNSIAV